MKRYEEDTQPEDEPEDELPDVNAEEEEPEQSISEAPTAQESFDPAELRRQNELLQQQVAQSRHAQQQQAANAIQQWLAQLPDDQREIARRRIEDQMREAEDKRRVMWTIAQKNGLQGKHLDEFYEVVQGVADPYTMERLGTRYRSFMDLEAGGGAQMATKEKPAMARTRPDAGAPQGNRSGGKRLSQEKIVAQYMPGGPKQGKVEELELEMERNGYYR